MGVEDKTGRIIGTQLDVSWLRQKISQGDSVGPEVIEHLVAGQRLLVIYIAPALELVDDTKGRLRWRIGDSCQTVDRSEWWQYREAVREYDQFAQGSQSTLDDIPESTLQRVRQLLGASVSETDSALLSRIGALQVDGYLSEATRLILTRTDRSWIEFVSLNVS